MQKIEAPRNEVREVAVAALYKQASEQFRIKRRLCELANLPYNPQEETQILTLTSLIVEPYVDSLMGVISEEEFLTKMKDVTKESIKTQIEQEQEEPIEGEEKEKLEQMVTAMMDSLLTYILPTDSQEKTFRYLQCVFGLAKEKGVAPKDIFASDELFKEVLRNVYTVEEYQERAAKGSRFLNPETLLDVLLKPVLGSLAKNEEEAAEMYEELKEEMQADPEFLKQMEASRNAFSQTMEEEIRRVYG